MFCSVTIVVCCYKEYCVRWDINQLLLEILFGDKLDLMADSMEGYQVSFKKCKDVI